MMKGWGTIADESKRGRRFSRAARKAIALGTRGKGVVVSLHDVPSPYAAFNGLRVVVLGRSTASSSSSDSAAMLPPLTPEYPLRFIDPSSKPREDAARSSKSEKEDTDDGNEGLVVRLAATTRAITTMRRRRSRTAASRAATRPVSKGDRDGAREARAAALRRAEEAQYP